MATTTQTQNKGSNVTKSNRPKYFSNPIKNKAVKDSIEQLKTYSLVSKGRTPTRDEKSAFISLGLPMAREEKK